MELDEATLFNQFIEETKNRRRAFFQHLEEKYVKNQHDSDIIHLNSLAVKRNKGQFKRIKDPVAFGFMRSYSCSKGRGVLKILRRKVRVKRKYRLTIYDNDEDSSYATDDSSFSNLPECFVKLVHLDLTHINTARCSDATIENLTLNRVPKLDYVKFPKFLKKQSFSDRISPGLVSNRKKYSSLISSDISICDLSLRSEQHHGNDNGKSKFRSHRALPAVKKPRTNFKKSNVDETHICVELEEELSITEDIIISDDVNIDDCSFRTANSHNSLPVFNKTGKDIIFSKNEKTHLFMNVGEVRKFYNNEINNKKFVSLYNTFGNLNLSNCSLENRSDLNSKISGKLTSYEINSLSRKSFGPSKEICSNSHPLQSCSISPLHCPAVSKLTLGYKTVPKKVSPQIDTIRFKKCYEGNSKTFSSQIDFVGLKNYYSRSTNMISSSYSPLKNISERQFNDLKRRLLF